MLKYVKSLHVWSPLTVAIIYILLESLLEIKFKFTMYLELLELL